MSLRASLQASNATLVLGLALSTLAGCGEGALLPPTFEPESGAWFYDELAVTQNTCPDQLYTPTDTMIAIVYEGGNSFDVNPGTEGAFDCSLSADEFECPSWARGSITVPTLNATVDYRVSAVGTFLSSTAATGENTYTYTCEGSQCETVELALSFTFPCSLRVQFDIERQ